VNGKGFTPHIHDARPCSLAEGGAPYPIQCSTLRARIKGA